MLGLSQVGVDDVDLLFEDRGHVEVDGGLVDYFGRLVCQQALLPIHGGECVALIHPLDNFFSDADDLEDVARHLHHGGRSHDLVVHGRFELIVVVVLTLVLNVVPFVKDLSSCRFFGQLNHFEYNNLVCVLLIDVWIDFHCSSHLSHIHAGEVVVFDTVYVELGDHERVSLPVQVGGVHLHLELLHRKEDLVRAG